MTDLVARLTLELENTKDFIEKYNIGKTGSYFDALPDEILYKILTYGIKIKKKKVNCHLCLVSKKFNQVIMDIVHNWLNPKNKFHKSYFQFLEKIDHWMEKILSFGFINTYRELLMVILRIVCRLGSIRMNDDLVMFRFTKVCGIHSFILSNDIYYYRFEEVMPLMFSKRSDNSPSKIIYFTDYNLEKYEIFQYNDDRDTWIYKSKYSTMHVDNNSVNLIHSDGVFNSLKNQYKPFLFDGYTFWIPKDTNSEEYKIISSEESPLPMTILKYFKP